MRQKRNQKCKRERSGAILTTELLLVMAILIGGLTAILTKLKDSVNTQMNEACSALQEINQQFLPKKRVQQASQAIQEQQRGISPTGQMNRENISHENLPQAPEMGSRFRVPSTASGPSTPVSP